MIAMTNWVVSTQADMKSIEHRASPLTLRQQLGG